MRYKYIKRVAALLTITLSLSACAISSKYPMVWPKALEITNDCKEYEGSYNANNYLISAFGGIKNGDQLFQLPNWLFNAGEGFDAISIQPNSSSDILISAISKGRIVATNNVTTNIRCETNQIFIEVDHSVSNGGVSGYEGVTLELRIATDGSLLIKSKSSFVGLIFLVPAITSEEQWRKFEKL